MCTECIALSHKAKILLQVYKFNEQKILERRAFKKYATFKEGGL